MYAEEVRQYRGDQNANPASYGVLLRADGAGGHANGQPRQRRLYGGPSSSLTEEKGRTIVASSP